VVKWQTR